MNWGSVRGWGSWTAASQPTSLPAVKEFALQSAVTVSSHRGVWCRVLAWPLKGIFLYFWGTRWHLDLELNFGYKRNWEGSSCQPTWCRTKDELWVWQQLGFEPHPTSSVSSNSGTRGSFTFTSDAVRCTAVLRDHIRCELEPQMVVSRGVQIVELVFESSFELIFEILETRLENQLDEVARSRFYWSSIYTMSLSPTVAKILSVNNLDNPL